MEESTDDDATKLEKTEMSKQSCEKQSQFVLIKKPDKKMKITKSKKNQRPLKKIYQVSYLLPKYWKWKRLPLFRRQSSPPQSLNARKTTVKQVSRTSSTTSSSSSKSEDSEQAELVFKRESNTKFGRTGHKEGKFREEDEIDEVINILVDSDKDNKMEVKTKQGWMDGCLLKRKVKVCT